MQILSLTSGESFTMGKGKNWRVIHPGMGASWITLNHALHDAGNEFVQHIHDRSDDIIVVLDGDVSLRQGSAYTPANKGDSLMIPAGEVHGTVNTGKKTARMVSFQSPPDMALYSGERNKSQDERPIPSRDRVSDVLVVRMKSGSPDFRTACDWRRVFGQKHGSSKMELWYGVLKSGQTIDLAENGHEGVVIVEKGSLLLSSATLPDSSLPEGAVVFLRCGDSILLKCKSKSANVIYCSALM
ncbi:MAG TPA: cupin domain-containing protein [Rectinemataceae bacterium]|nr:cupin domain-containing protein [Rectinemataceae bacterium]